jgi:hypothetical protein
MTIVIFQMAALIWNERLVWNKGTWRNENPARWGSTDGAVQSKSSARFGCVAWLDIVTQNMIGRRQCDATMM